MWSICLFINYKLYSSWKFQTLYTFEILRCLTIVRFLLINGQNKMMVFICLYLLFFDSWWWQKYKKIQRLYWFLSNSQGKRNWMPNNLGNTQTKFCNGELRNSQHNWMWNYKWESELRRIAAVGTNHITYTCDIVFRIQHLSIYAQSIFKINIESVIKFNSILIKIT